MQKEPKNVGKKLKIAGVVVIGLLILTILFAILTANKRIYLTNPEILRSMTYEQVQVGDEKVDGTDYVQFDAFFLRDLNLDGNAEGIRGSCREVGEEDILYMELNVLTNGYLKDGVITINGNNFYFESAIPKDNEIKENAIGINVKEIQLNTINNGTQKLLTGKVKAGNYTYNRETNIAIGNNINNYTNSENNITLTGTHVAEDGTETPISKTVYFIVDWHGSVVADIPNYFGTISNLKRVQELESAIDEENNTFTVRHTFIMQETNCDLILEKAYIEGIIPELNGYKPIEVNVSGSNIEYTYDETTGQMTAQKIAIVDENGNITSQAYDEISSNGYRYNSFNVNITYPLEAYLALGADTVASEVTIRGYYEGFNNQNEEFENPYKSNIIEKTFHLTVRNPQGDVARFDVYVGKYLYSPERRYVVSKEKPLKIYNNKSYGNEEDTYVVRWVGNTGLLGNMNGLVMKETKNGENQVSDVFVTTDGTEISMEEITTNVGIYFDDPTILLGEEGWVKVYDDETDELIETFTADNWNSYSETNPYRYQTPVRHVRIETSATVENSYITIFHLKALDDNKIIETFSREEFDSLVTVKSTLSGYMDGVFYNTDIHLANYEAPYSIATIKLDKTTLSTQQTEKNVVMTIDANVDAYANQVEWINGSFLVKLPKDIVAIDINDITISNSKVEITSYEKYIKDDVIYIKINTANTQPASYEIKINCNITPDPRITTKSGTIELYSDNENALDYWNNVEDIFDINDNLNTTEMIGLENTEISLVSPNSLLTAQTVTNYDDKGSIAVSPQSAEIKKSQRTADINVYLTNNYNGTISGVKLLGRVPFEGNKYVINQGDLGSEFSVTMNDTGIILPENLKEEAVIYYSENGDATTDLNDTTNGWTTSPTDFAKVKSYLIDFKEHSLQRGESHGFTYTVTIPEGIDYNKVSYSHFATYFNLDTEEGKYATKTEPNRVGLLIASRYDVEIIKYQLGKEKLVPGATYSITEVGQEESRTSVTNAEGKLILSGFYVDKTYLIKEIKSPAEYELNPEEIVFKATEEDGELKQELISGIVKNIQAIQEQDEQQAKIQIEVEDEAKARIRIIKENASTQERLPNVKFKLTGKNYEQGRILSTDGNGEGILIGLKIGEEYTLEEVSNEGYYLGEAVKFNITNTDGVYSVNITEGTVKNSEITEEDSIPVANLTIDNEEIPKYNLQINKVAKGETTPLSNVVFKLYKGTKEIGKYTTNEQGIITINDLYLYEAERDIDQTYTLKEISAPVGYSKIKDLTFKVEDKEGLLVMDVTSGTIKEQSSSDNTITITIENSPSFKLIKKDEETKEVLPNTKFAIYNVDDGTEQLARDSKNNILGTKEIINGKEYYILTTNENGEIEADLREGLYKAVEIQASHDKYDITDNEYYFGINASNQAAEEMRITYAESIGGDGAETINSIAKTADGGYIVVGTFREGEVTIGSDTFTNEEYYVDGLIIKYDSNDNPEWAMHIDGSSYIYLNCVIQTEDYGYLIGGHSYSGSIQIGDQTFTGDSGDGLSIKLDLNGNVENVNFGGYEVLSIAETSDGGYITAGTFDSSSRYIGDLTLENNGREDALVIKYDSNNIVEWVVNAGGNYEDYFESIVELPSGEYIAVGYFDSKTIQVGEETYTNSSEYSESEGLLVRIGENGEILSSMQITGGGRGLEFLKDVIVTSDGGYIAIGISCSNSVQIGDRVLENTLKRDFSGDELYNGYMGMIIKFNSNHEVEWAKTIEDEMTSSMITQIEETSNGNYIISGYSGFDHGYTMDSGSRYNTPEVGLLVEINSTGEIIRKENIEIVGITDVTPIGENKYKIVGVLTEPVINLGEKNIVRQGYYDGIIATYELQEVNIATVKKMDSISSSKNEYITSVQNTEDGGYIAVGYFDSSSVSVGNNILTNTKTNTTDGMIVKYDINHNIEWTKSFGGNGNEYTSSIIETKDNGYIVIGYFDSDSITIENITLKNSGGNDGFVIKYGNSGDFEWAKSFGGNSDDYINSVIETKDEDFVIVGDFDSNTMLIGDYLLTNQGNYDGFVMKTGNRGEVKWAKSFGGSDEDKASSVIESVDGEYLVGGHFTYSAKIGNTNITASEITDGLIIKYTSDGMLKDYVQLKGDESDYSQNAIIKIYTMEKTSDGGYIVSGKYESDFKIGEYYFEETYSLGEFIIKFSKNNTVEWAKEIDLGDSDNKIEDVYETNNGKYIIVANFTGMTAEVDGNLYYNKAKTEYIYDYDLPPNGLIILYEKNGKFEWAKPIEGDNTDVLTSVIQLNDGRYVVGGYFDSSTIGADEKSITNQGGYDALLLSITEYANIADIQEVVAENERKEFEITTDVKEIDGVKGGSISGEDLEPYETVKYGDSNLEKIVMIPDENYEIIGITVNEEDHIFTANEDGTYTLPQFTNITEDKHIVVTYALKSNKIVINKVDSKTKETLEGVQFKLDQIDERANPNVEEIIKEELSGYSKTYYEADENATEVTEVVGGLTTLDTQAYYFVQQSDGSYVPTNSKTYQLATGGTAGIQSATANSYIPIDLSGLTGKYELRINASVSSQSSDYGYATLTPSTTTTSPGYSSDTTSTPRIFRISGTQEAKDYTYILDGGSSYNLHLGYRKSSSTDTGDDQIVFNSIKIYEATKGVTYNFTENNGVYTSTNQGKHNTIAASCIPIDLTDYTGKYNLTINAKISSEYYDYGYAMIKTDETYPSYIYSSSSGVFAYIRGTQSAQDYTTVLDGGKMHYLHIGYEKNAAVNSGTDTFTINSIDITLNDSELYHTEVETNIQGQAITQVPMGRYTITETKPLEGYEALSNPITIDFKEGNKAIVENTNGVNAYVNEAGEYVIENQAKGKVIVHHYLKDGDTYTTTPVAEDETYIDSIGKEYTTSPKVDLVRYELEKDADGNYVTPDNASGQFAEGTIEVTYYYELRDIPLLVRHFIQGTETPVPLADGSDAQEKTTRGNEGEGYTTTKLTPEELHPGYEYVEVVGEEVGTYNFDNELVVTYYYRLSEVPLTVKHLIQGTETPVPLADGTDAQEENYTGTYGEEYTTNALTEDELDERYVLVTVPENANGTYAEEAITVIYEYQLKDPVVTEQTIEKSGTTKIEVKDESVTYHIQYSAKVEEYSGEVQVTVVDTLPYAIDTSKEYDIAGGSYDETTKTITWKEIVDVDTYTNGIATINFSKDIQVVFKDIVVTETEMVNTASGKIKLYTPEKEPEEVTDTETTIFDFTKDITATKEWVDTNNQAGKRPEQIKVIVKNGEVEVATQVLTEANKVDDDTWSYTFESLPKYNEDGTEATYTVEEQEVTEGDFKFYEGTIDQETHTITNTFTVPNDTVEVTASKVWNHGESIYTKPVEVILVVKNGEVEVARQTVTEANKVGEDENTWSYTFTDLAKYDELGNEITYTIAELEVTEGDFVYYESSINQDTKTVTNTYIGPEISQSKEVTTENGEDYVVEGEKVTYKVTVENAGQVAKDVVVKDSIPEGMTFVEGSIKVNGTETTNTLEDLTTNGITVNVPVKTGETNGKVEVTFDVTVDELPEGEYTKTYKNTATVDDKPTNETTTIANKSNVTFEKEVNPASGSKVEIGQELTYTIKISNSGILAKEVIVKDTIPTGTTFVANSVTVDGQSTTHTATDLANGITVNVGEDSEVVVSFKVTVNTGLEDGTVITNLAYVDDTPTNEVTNEVITPIISQSKAFETENGEDYVEEGEKVTYKVTVENAGQLAKDVIVKDSIPEGMTFVEGSIKVNGTATTKTLEDLQTNGITVNVPAKTGETNGKVEVSFEVTVDELPKGEYTKTYRNTATVDDEDTNTTETTSKKPNITAVKEVNPESGSKVTIGQELTYTIKISNSGTLAKEVIVKDTIPTGTTFVANSVSIDGQSTTHTAENLASGITVNVAEGTEVAVSFKVTVNTGLEDGTVITNLAYVDDEPTEEVTNEVITPIISQSKAFETEKELGYVVEGEKVTYKVTIENAGQLAKEVIVKDSIPEGMTFVEGSIKVNGQNVENTLEDLTTNGIKVNVPARTEDSEGAVTNGKAEVSFVVTVDNLPEGTYEKTLRNTATVDDEPTNETETVVNKSNITVTKEVNPESGSKVKIGDTLTYTIKVANSGTLAKEVTVKDTIPTGATFVEGSIEVNDLPTIYTASELEAGIPVAVNANSEVTVVFEVTVNEGLTNGDIIRNVAYIDETPTNEVTNKVITPIISAQKTVEVETGNNYVQRGDRVDYTIIVRNSGELGKDVIVKDSIPEGTTFVEGSIVVDGQNTNYTESDLATGIDIYVGEMTDILPTAVTVKFSVTVNEDASGQIRNIAVVDGKDTNEVSNPVITQEKSYEIVRKTEGELPEGTVTAADEIVYKIIVKNTGTTDAGKIVVTDTVPEGTTFKEVAGNATEENGLITWELEGIKAGASKELTFSVVVDYARKDGQIKNTAYVNDEPTNETTTEYVRPEIVLTSELVKDGELNAKVVSTDLPIYYELTYTATVNQFIGDADLTIIDYLPYPIDETKSELADGTYDAETKTITWKERIDNIDTYKDGGARTINRTKLLSLQYIYGEAEESLSGTIENTATSLIELKEPSEEDPSKEVVVKTDEKEDDHEVPVEIPAEVIVHHYLYENGPTTTKLADDENIKGIVGDEYKTSKSKDVSKEYLCKNEQPEKFEGTMTKSTIEVIYYYELTDETLENTITKDASIDVLRNESGKVGYTIKYNVVVKDYVGKAKVVITDKLPAGIDLDKSNLAGGSYDANSRTITWEETLEGIDTFANGEYTKTITKEIELVYEDQNVLDVLVNTAKGTVTTYYPDNHPTKSGEEKKTEEATDTEEVSQEYKVDKTVMKVWEDSNNARGNRPESVKVFLTANGSATGQEAILSNANGWEYTFRDLAKYDQTGAEIKYSAVEAEVNTNDLEYYEDAEVSVLDKIIVTNEYKLKNTQLDSKIVKDGTEKITASNEAVTYNISYQAVVKEYIGGATLTITDTLPYKIDVNKSALAGGSYDADTQTIKWVIPTGHINTDVNGDFPINVTRTIKVVYTNLDASVEKMTNHIEGKLEFTQNDTKNKVEDTHDTLIDISGNVIVKYVDEVTGVEIANREEMSGKVGQGYKTEQKDIPYYTYTRNSGNTVGKIEEGTITVIYYYNRTPSGGLIVKYVDERGEEIADREGQSGYVGEEYTTEQKEIEGYEFEKITGEPTGKLIEGVIEVIYHYKNLPTNVIVRYLEKGTEEPIADEDEITGKVGYEYETTRKVIEGYRKAEPEPENAVGIMTKDTIYVTYYYEKIPSGKIIVKHVEITTKEEITYVDENGEEKTYREEMSGYIGERYTTEEKDIPHYEYVKELVPANKEGAFGEDDDIVIYYYRKLPFNMAVDKTIKAITVNGKEVNLKGENKVAKQEVVASRISTTEVKVTYEITVRNTEKVAGKVYVEENIPAYYHLESYDTNIWKKDGEKLIATLELQPGESRTYEVVTKWDQTTESFGESINIVKIAGTENEPGYEETTLDDNSSQTIVVMSIKTGRAMRIGLTMLGFFSCSGLLVLLYQYQVYNKERNRAIRHVVLEGENVVIRKKEQK